MSIAIILADYHNSRHAADLVTVLQGYAQDPMGGGNSLPPEVCENLVPRLANFPTAFTMLAYAGDRAVGLANCFLSLSTFSARELVNIHDVAVLPEFRGQGIGTRLLDAVEQFARNRGCCKLTLEVLEGNRVAQAVYNKLGFAPYALDERSGPALFWQKIL